jgi:hypothetical protein
VSADVAPTADEYVPAGHSLHILVAGSDHDPAGHSLLGPKSIWHDVDPAGEIVPSGHLFGVTVPAGQYVLIGQIPHVVGVWR